MKNIIIFFAIVFYMTGCKTPNTMKLKETIRVHAIRLKPGEDLREKIEQYMKAENIAAGWVSTCAGSLTQYNIRFANNEAGSTGNGHFEIVSLSGTVSVNGCHLHISISDSTGKSIGGHLLSGCKIYTTAEIIIQSSSEYIFKREKDGSTPWEELQIERILKVEKKD